MISHDYAIYSNYYAELDMGGTFYLAFRDLQSFIPNGNNEKSALDFGSGAGRSSRFLKSLGDYKVIGVDRSLEMIEQAKLRNGGIDFLQINGNKLPFDAEYFDLVFSSFVFIEQKNLMEITKILSEMKRVLKTNGRIVFVVPIIKDIKDNWVSFEYDYPENEKELKSGTILKLSIKNSGIILYDYNWLEDDYLRAIKNAGLVVIDKYMPLGNNADPIEWKDEKNKEYFWIFVAGK
jgi:ubiquinone/menaquinone biosynthesis C-methylase UbiE